MDRVKLHVTYLWEKWYYKFGFIREKKVGHAYAAMLGLATSVNHLQRLHDSLPENARLLRDDWIKFVDLWKKYFTGSEAEKCREQLEVWILEQQLIHRKANLVPGSAEKYPPADATNYYIECITKGREHRLASDRYLPDEPDKPIRILSSREKKGRGYTYFLANMFNSTFDMEFRLANARKVIQASLIVKQRQLTEELTFKLSSLLGYYINGYGGDACGVVLDVTFDINAEGLRQFLKSWRGNLLAKREFLSAAADELRKSGVPIEGDLCRAIAMNLTPPEIDD